ncbi:MAG TPA: caspase family protein [Kofleriaceae bacterium]|nr:caspase family protein [Kofleriaceae bacterium]
MIRFRDVVSQDDQAACDAVDGRSCIAVIGIDRYRTWEPLRNAVQDARGTLKLFTQLGFEPVCEPLFDDDTTGAALRCLPDRLGVLGPDDSLVLFFAGHGHTVTRTYPGGASVKKGYVIPVDGDGPDGDASTWLRLDTWLSDIAQVPMRHLLVLIDACHSGVALDPTVRWRGKGIGFAGPLGQLHTRRSRRIITSALDDELAMDSGPVPGHSLFTGCLIEGLTGGLLGSTSNALVTGTDIARYIQRRVIDYPNSKQTPDFGALELDDRGELVVRLVVPVAKPQDEPVAHSPTATAFDTIVDQLSATAEDAANTAPVAATESSRRAEGSPGPSESISETVRIVRDDNRRRSRGTLAIATAVIGSAALGVAISLLRTPAPAPSASPASTRGNTSAAPPAGLPAPTMIPGAATPPTVPPMAAPTAVASDPTRSGPPHAPPEATPAVPAGSHKTRPASGNSPRDARAPSSRSTQGNVPRGSVPIPGITCRDTEHPEAYPHMDPKLPPCPK